MRIDPARAIGAYAAATTLMLAWFTLGAAAPDAAQFKTIDVERINIREPDGTLRMAISNHARMPGIVVGKREYPHPNRPEAGMIFYNDEGIENGGLAFDGGLKAGKATNGGSLTFDRYRQDQTLQFVSTEDGQDRQAAVIVNDRPEGMIDYAALPDALVLPHGPARDAALAKLNLGGAKQRAYLGRSEDRSSQLVLRDGAGRPRLTLRVTEQGDTAVEFRDAAGRLTRTVR